MLASWWRRVQQWLRERSSIGPLRIVAARPLHGGAAIYVADVDGRRLVFASGTSSTCLLASYSLREHRRWPRKGAPKNSNGMTSAGSSR